jgi:choline dehydrogenase-like flavoprotein
MATARAEVNAVLIGVGLVGSILGRELTRAGLRVAALLRGTHQRSYSLGKTDMNETPARDRPTALFAKLALHIKPTL